VHDSNLQYFSQASSSHLFQGSMKLSGGLSSGRRPRVEARRGLGLGTGCCPPCRDPENFWNL